MNKDIEEYIENEKSFSKFKIKTLERASFVGKDRLIKKEREFISFDFKSVDFSDLEECREALDTFRVSKRDFLKKYKKVIATESFESQKAFIVDKINNIRVDTVGVIDGHKFKCLSGKKIFNSDKSLRSLYQKMLNLCIDLLNLILSYGETYGKFPRKIYEVFDFIPDYKGSFLYLNNSLTNIDDSIVSCISNKTEKTSLIVLNLKHSSNEKVNIIYERIFDDEGNRILPTRSKFATCSIDDEYYKAIPISSSDVDKINLSTLSVAVGKSRRCMEHIIDARMWLKLILMEIEEIF